MNDLRNPGRALQPGPTDRRIPPVSPMDVVRALGRLIAVAAVPILAGCSTVQSMNPWHSDERPASTNAAPGVLEPSKAENEDPLLRLVGAMPMMTPQGFREPATGETLSVRVVRAYAAASGRSCREFVVVFRSGDEQRRLACASSGRWISARPLRQETVGSTATRVQ